LFGSHLRTYDTPFYRRIEGWERYGARADKQGIAQEIGVYYVKIVQTISLKLPDDLLAQIENEAKARRVTKSSLIRESLERALRPQPPAGSPSCYDLARDLAGSIKGLPEDLARNPKYMEGFGR
jgi:hypothetical protein